jgi:diguanylate cyclase (GGDEF)-like protein
MSWLQVITGLSRNLADIVFFIVVINRLYPHLIKCGRTMQKPLFGALFGIASILSMQMPIIASAGVYVDIKTILIALAGVIGGYRAATIAVIMTGGYRMLLGGVGGEAAIAAILTSGLLGAVYYELENRNKITSTSVAVLLFGMIISIESIGWSFLLPPPIANSVVALVSVPLLIIMPLTAWTFHYFVIVPWKQHQTASDLPEAQIQRPKPFAEQLGCYIENSNNAVVILFHIYNFKNLNNLYTYSMGSELLEAVRLRLSELAPDSLISQIRDNDFAYCIKSFKSSEYLLAEAERIHSLLCMPYMVQKRYFHIEVSAGLAVYTGEETADMLTHRADTALKHAKDSGPKRIVQYHAKLAEDQLFRLRVEEELHQALENKQLSVRYQPQFDIRTGAVRGFEALLRWNHPELGPVAPDSFIPAAEENLTILPIGLWVLREACRTHRSVILPQFPDAVMCVNISAVQLKDVNFPQLVAQTLTSIGLPANRLELEITETTLIASIDSACQRLEELARIGVKIALDDFGTGYSSLYYLNRLPLHLVKLDKTFIRDICKPNEGKITESIIRFIQDLQISVVAEGVESYDQLYRLKQWKCDIVQGYLLGRPLSEEDMPSFIAKQNTA